MNRSLPAWMAAPLLAITVQACAAPAGAPAEAPQTPAYVERDNVFVLRFGDGVNSVAFNYYGDHDISPNQPMGIVESIHGLNRLDLHVHAGRRRSPQVGVSWRERLKDEDRHMFGTGKLRSTTRPSSLNFWVGGQLLINGQQVADEFYLAQGSNWFHNNWWLGTVSGVNQDQKVFRFADAQGRQFCLTEQAVNDVTLSVCSPN